ncbi:MAG: low molecular weight protein arginine phosphatase [Candidatus Krumholzibacteriota bacterium]|nr:low molecular weight protein arginine phosphatase [Candidatus Krumholzibacteriota bacterium]
MKKIVFICTGNTCRSPMAEAITRARLPSDWKDKFEISSAGAFAWNGQPATPLAVEVLREIGIDLSSHSARLMTGKIIREAELIVPMTDVHRLQIIASMPEVSSRVVLLGGLDDSREDVDIADPLGGSRAVYKKTRDEIYDLVTNLIDYIAEKFDLKK